MISPHIQSGIRGEGDYTLSGTTGKGRRVPPGGTLGAEK